MSKKIIVLLSICCFAAFSSAMIYVSCVDRADDALPVINTLSNEQLMGLGYTTASKFDDSDIWEDEEYPSSVSASSEDETVSAASVSFPVDINIATAEELMLINGIGSATAEKIISYRNDHGYFYSPDDLLNIDGIGSKKLAAIKDYIYISPDISAVKAETTAATADNCFTE